MAELRLPALVDEVVRLRPWRESDVPAALMCRAGVGYWLAPHARGRGVVTHAVRLVARCGFTREGVLRAHMPFKGGRRDTVVFGLLPGELR